MERAAEQAEERIGGEEVPDADVDPAVEGQRGEEGERREQGRETPIAPPEPPERPDEPAEAQRQERQRRFQREGHREVIPPAGRADPIEQRRRVPLLVVQILEVEAVGEIGREEGGERRRAEQYGARRRGGGAEDPGAVVRAEWLARGAVGEVDHG